MSSFRIVSDRPGLAPRVYHDSDPRLAVALICPEDDGTVCLFPVKFEGAPYPLTGRSAAFPDVAAVAAFLGISADAREALAA